MWFIMLFMVYIYTYFWGITRYHLHSCMYVLQHTTVYEMCLLLNQFAQLVSSKNVHVACAYGKMFSFALKQSSSLFALLAEILER